MVLQSEPPEPMSAGGWRRVSGALAGPAATDEDSWPPDEGEAGDSWPGDDADEWPPHFGAARMGIP